jgi:hypothetical protein
MNNSSNPLCNIDILGKKVMFGAVAAAVFVMVSCPKVYEQSSKVTTTINDSCPTAEGKFIHTAVFFVVNYVLMKMAPMQKYYTVESISDGLIVKYAFMATLLFFMLSSADSYKLTGRLVPGLANAEGCPEFKGLIVHGLVFLVVLVLMMYFPKD